MNIFLELMIFLMGTVFGSFFTLAVYRIPLKKDITHERSFCPNCEHKLEFLDLIPVLSYIFLRGKCRYCGTKVRIRYLILEVLSGIVFVLAYKSINFGNIMVNLYKLPIFISFVFMYITLVIVSGIDKEYRNINSSVLLFGAICQAIYILYLYIVVGANVYRYGIYFAIFIVLFILKQILQKKKNTYFMQVLLLLSYVLLATNLKYLGIIVVAGLVVAIFLHFCCKKDFKSLPLGFCIGLSTICVVLVENFLRFYIK